MNSDSAETLGKRLAALRDRRGWTQKQLAQKANISTTFLSEVENDKRNLSSEVLLRIANALGASLDYVMRGETTSAVPSQSLVIPAELAIAAEDHGWSYTDTVALLRAQLSVVARRTKTGEIEQTRKTLSRDEWILLYNALIRDA